MMDEPRSFDWTQSHARLGAILQQHRLEFDPQRYVLTDDTLEFRPPTIQRVPGPDAPTCTDTLYESLLDPPGLHVLVLVRAGATALGIWRDDELLAHKAFKRYVVRGKGRAQPTHLATKGKSRYGSRLRLQNAKRQLEETGERLHAWIEEYGPVRAAFVAAPERLWADLKNTSPGIPFDNEQIVSVPFHAHTPTFDEVQRVHRKLRRGRVDKVTADQNPPAE